MKVFLNICFIAMLSAGIYGTVDLALDMKNGTYILYEGEELPTLSALGTNNRFITRPPAVHLAVKEVKKVEKKVPALLTINELSFDDFSRGEPPMMLDEILMGTPSIADSLTNTAVSVALADTAKALSEIKSASAGVKKEERKFSLKLYSRGRPRPVVKEPVALKKDSLQNP